ncbi:DsrE family protein [Geotalea toluenoxydans]|uniref:DsrE family protein n=1 Tax=Geotalea toluenoxydans TaxID=421624 RepID=UPI0006D17824|nr:DsrE family protein [Geotalea toluenoxydans]
MALKSITLTTSALVLVASLLGSMNAWAGHSNDAAALEGVKQGKGIFLVDTDNPQKTALYLNLINETHKSLAAQKVKSDLVVVFIGPTVRFLTAAPEAELAAKHQEFLKSITATVKELDRKGVRMEVCEIATGVFKVPVDKLLPGLKLVGNGFISLIGYQSKGYGLVPIF